MNSPTFKLMTKDGYITIIVGDVSVTMIIGQWGRLIAMPEKL